MKKLLISITITTSFIMANIMSLQYNGVKVDYDDGYGSIKKIIIEREIDPVCISIPMSNEIVWEGLYASREVSKRCKSTFVTTVGQIQPITVHPKVETFGELEVLNFIKDMKGKKDMLLIDCRTDEWYDYRTIPNAINIAYLNITKPLVFVDEFKEGLKTLGVKGKKGSYDFTNSKTITLFCNGSWCSQSGSMIKSLIKIGYPAEKIKWYRGGMDDWLSMSMTTTRP